MTDTTAKAAAPETVTAGDALTIDVVREEVAVRKELVETARVEVAKTVLTEEVALTLEHLEHGVDVERRPVNETFDELPAGTVQLEDGTVVYRVIREVPVVVTRYEVVEEILVRPSHVARDERVIVPVRAERVDIRRTPLAAATPAIPAPAHEAT